MKNIFQIIVGVVIGVTPFVFSEEVQLQTSSGILYGTLELPTNDRFGAVVLIIAGSGPTDRDGNFMSGAPNDSLKLTAEGLARCGIASLRYDKRGIGASAEALDKEENITIETLIDDAALWAKKMRSDKRFSKLYVLGHSEGSLIGMIISEKIMPDGFISIAGLGQPGWKALLTQLKPKLPSNLYKISEDIVDRLRRGDRAQDVPQALYSLFRPSVQPYLIAYFRRDPRVEISKLNIPILIVQGTADLQVSEQDAKLLSKANSSAWLKFIPGMNHVLKDVPLNDYDMQQKSYIDSSLPVDASLIRAICDFIK